MNARVLIVEDEMLIASDVAAILADLGHQAVGIAPDLATAMALADQPIDLALVDLNRRDGLTGPEIGQRLSQTRGVAVLFVAADPRILGNGIAGTVGVLTKPASEQSVREAVEYALRTARGEPVAPPATLSVFAKAA